MERPCRLAASETRRLKPRCRCIGDPTSGSSRSSSCSGCLLSKGFNSEQVGWGRRGRYLNPSLNPATRPALRSPPSGPCCNRQCQCTSQHLRQGHPRATGPKLGLQHPLCLQLLPLLPRCQGQGVGWSHPCLSSCHPLGCPTSRGPVGRGLPNLWPCRHWAAPPPDPGKTFRYTDEWLPSSRCLCGGSLQYSGVSSVYGVLGVCWVCTCVCGPPVPSTCMHHPSLATPKALFTLRLRHTGSMTVLLPRASPVCSGTGFCTESTDFILGLHALGVPVSASQHGDSVNPTYQAGMPEDVRATMERLASGYTIPDIAVCHSAPGFWFRSDTAAPCPPSGARYSVGRTMFEVRARPMEPLAHAIASPPVRPSVRPFPPASRLHPDWPMFDQFAVPFPASRPTRCPQIGWTTFAESTKFGCPAGIHAVREWG